MKIILTLLLSLHFAAAAAEGNYSTIRKEILLPSDFTPRISESQTLKKLPEFKVLNRTKVFHFSEPFLHYVYSSESVDDTEWGCAWRGIQTVLSAHYKADPKRVPSFKELYETFGDRSFLEKQLVKRYKNLPSEPWLAPHEEWHMWADPVVGQMILQSLGIKNTLITLNDYPNSFMPKVSDAIVTFPTLKNSILMHFRRGGYPLMIDNGTYALNILGAGQISDRLYLLIGDPHLKFDRDDNPLNGLYTIELDRNGEQISIDYPAAYNHFDPGSYETLKFTPDTKWNLLFAN